MRKSDRNFIIFAIFFTCLTGLALFIFDEFFKIETEYGFRTHPWLDEIKFVHNIFNFIFIFAVGKIFNGHIIHGLMLRKNRHQKTGFVLVFCILLLCLSGCFLLYNSEDYFMGQLGNLHLFIGLAFVFTFIFHLYSYWKWKKLNR